MIVIGLLGAVVVVLSVLLILSVIPLSATVVGALFLLLMLAIGVPYWRSTPP